MTGDPFVELRRQKADDREDAAREREHVPSGSPAYLGQTYDGGAYPTAVPAIYLTRPVEADGDEAEGAVPTFAADGATSVPVLVIGPHVPAVGAKLIARRPGPLWVARAGGGSYGGIGNYVCGTAAIPKRDLAMTWRYTNTSGGTTSAAVSMVYLPDALGPGVDAWGSGLIYPSDYPPSPTPASADCPFGSQDVGVYAGHDADATQHSFTLRCGSDQILLIHGWTCGGLGQSSTYGPPAYVASPFGLTYSAGMELSDIGFTLA